MRRVVLGLTGLLLVPFVVTGCGGGSAADDAAKRVASQLAAGKLTSSAFSGATAAQKDYDATVAGMDKMQPTVRVHHTTTKGDRATAELAWSWPVQPDHPWSYTTKVSLRHSGGDWLADWTRTDVAPGLADDQRLRSVRVPATRGELLGAGGAAIVKPRPVVRFGLDKHQLKPDQYVDSAQRLARLLGVDEASYVKQVKANGPKAFVIGLTLRAGDVPSSVQQGYTSIPGAYAQHGTLPLAPSRTFAAALLGTVGQATAEIVKKSKGRVQAGDEVGLSGLQLRYDTRLAGSPGVRIESVDAKGKAEQLFTAEPVAGKPLQVTLVPRLQSLAEQSLAGVGPASALVAIRPSTGDILAAASGPGSKGYNTATFAQYAPGSTFKIVSTLALLREGLTPQTPVHCTPSISVDGKQFTNDSEYPPSGLGTIPLITALANSCNTAYISQHDKLHGNDLPDAAAALGFGVDHDTGFPSFFGQVPPAASETEGAADMIGQGKVLASPMAMAAVVASVVAGKAVVPRLVSGDSPTAPSTVQPSHPLTAKEADELRTMMRAVVTTPTGTGAGLADVPGAPVIAKTGTAEFGDKPPLATHAWMVAGQGDLVVAVFVDRGHTGAGTAGPILERFLRDR